MTPSPLHPRRVLPEINAQAPTRRCPFHHLFGVYMIRVCFVHFLMGRTHNTSDPLTRSSFVNPCNPLILHILNHTHLHNLVVHAIPTENFFQLFHRALVRSKLARERGGVAGAPKHHRVGVGGTARDKCELWPCAQQMLSGDMKTSRAVHFRHETCLIVSCAVVPFSKWTLVIP